MFFESYPEISSEQSEALQNANIAVVGSTTHMFALGQLFSAELPESNILTAHSLDQARQDLIIRQSHDTDLLIVDMQMAKDQKSLERGQSIDRRLIEIADKVFEHPSLRQERAKLLSELRELYIDDAGFQLAMELLDIRPPLPIMILGMVTDAQFWQLEYKNLGQIRNQRFPYPPLLIEGCAELLRRRKPIISP